MFGFPYLSQSGRRTLYSFDNPVWSSHAMSGMGWWWGWSTLQYFTLLIIIIIIIIITLIINNPLTMRVSVAQQMTLEPVLFIFLSFPHSPRGLANLWTCLLTDVVFPPLPLSTLPFTAPACITRSGFELTHIWVIMYSSSYTIFTAIHIENKYTLPEPYQLSDS